MTPNSLNNYFYIALGGALGAVLRVYLGSLLPYFISGIVYLDKLPLPILIINIIGCFFMGLLSEFLGVYIPANYNIRLFLISGLLGGFTTFSAFSLEFGVLWQKNFYSIAVLYSVLSFILSILAFFMGVKLVKLVFA